MRGGRWTGGAAAVVAGIGIAAATGLAVGVVVAGGLDPPRTLTTDEFRGLTLFEVHQRVSPWDPDRLPTNFGYVTYFISNSVTGRPTDLETTDHDPEWTVVASCYLDDEPPGIPIGPTVVLGVVPRVDVTPQITELARARAYDHFLGECPGTRVTFTAPPPPEDEP